MNKTISTYPIPIHCDYCGGVVIFTSNAAIYGREYGSGKCYKCTACDAYVGVHNGTEIPLGRLANKELRELKKQCHNLFDLAWKGRSKRITRAEAYKRLASLLGIPARECHFGWFDKDRLTRALEILQDQRWYDKIKV